MSKEGYSLLKFDEYISDCLSIKTIDEGSNNVYVLRLFLKLLEYSGHGIPWITAAVYLVYLNQDRPFFVNLLMALVIDLAIVSLIKTIIQRPRPAYNIEDMFATVSVDRYSFPSGHTSRVVMVALLFTLYWTNALLIKFGYIWAAMVALSRIALGRHHVLDVIAGVVIGYAQYCLMLKYWLTQDTVTNIFELLNSYWTKNFETQ